MADLWLGDFGLRVTDFERSIRFYTSLFDFEELVREDYGYGKYILLRPKESRFPYFMNLNSAVQHPSIRAWIEEQ